MKTHVKKYSQGEMLSLETKQFGGKLLPDSDLRGAVFLEEVSRSRPERKRALWRPRRRWEDNIKVDLQEVGCGVGTGLSWLRIGTGGRHL